MGFMSFKTEKNQDLNRTKSVFFQYSIFLINDHNEIMRKSVSFFSGLAENYDVTNEQPWLIFHCLSYF